MKKLSISMTREETLMGWLFLFIQLLFLPWLLSTISAIFQWPSSDAELNFLMFAINFGLTLLIFHKFLWQSMKRALKTPFLTLRYAIWGLVLYYLADFLISMLIQAVNPSFSNLNDASIISMTQQHFTLISIGTVVLVPVAEEVLYRGLLFGVLQRKNRLLAYLTSVTAFSLIHIVGYLYSYEPLQLLISFLQYLPAGICLAWAYEKADSIWAPILMHMTINQIALSVMR